MAVADHPARGARRTDVELLGARPPRSLLCRPLDFIRTDHDRQRAVGAALRRFAESGRADTAAAQAVARFVSEDVPMHHADETEDLFPALRRRCIAADGIEGTLSALDDEHAALDGVLARLVAILSAPADGGFVAIPDPAAHFLRAFAATLHHHLAVENAIVLPIAKVRLHGEDLSDISARMAGRRRAADATRRPA